MYALNTQQQEAVNFNDGVAMVVAIPSSGKTTILTQRITALVQRGVVPENIMGVTFTKNAANTLKTRLKVIIGDKANRLAVSTIHSFCYRVLRSEGILFEIMADSKKLSLLRTIADHFCKIKSQWI